MSEYLDNMTTHHARGPQPLPLRTNLVKSHHVLLIHNLFKERLNSGQGESESDSSGDEGEDV